MPTIPFSARWRSELARAAAGKTVVVREPKTSCAKAWARPDSRRAASGWLSDLNSLLHGVQSRYDEPREIQRRVARLRLTVQLDHTLRLLDAPDEFTCFHK
jgi:hypothetical protein